MVRAPRKIRPIGTRPSPTSSTREAKEPLGEATILHPVASELGIIDVPNFQASSVTIASTGIDFIFLFSGLRQTLGAKGAPEAALVPSASVVMSRGAAADLHLVLTGILESVERDLGPVETPFLQERRKAKK